MEYYDQVGYDWTLIRVIHMFSDQSCNKDVELGWISQIFELIYGREHTDIAAIT